MKERQVRVLTIVLIVHLIVLWFTLRDLRRQPDPAVRGSKRFWRVAASLNTTGSAAYWLVGRRRRAVTPAVTPPQRRLRRLGGRLSSAPAHLHGVAEQVEHGAIALDRQGIGPGAVPQREIQVGRRAAHRARGVGRASARAGRPGTRGHAVGVDPQQPGRVVVSARHAQRRGRLRRARRWNGAARSRSTARRHHRPRRPPRRRSVRCLPPLPRRPGGWQSRGPGGAPTWRAATARARRSSTRGRVVQLRARRPTRVHPSPNQPASASSAGHEPTMSSRSNFADLGPGAGHVASRPAVHAAHMAHEIAHLPLRARRHRGIGAGRLGRGHHQRTFVAQRLDVGRDLHGADRYFTLRRSMTKTRVSLGAMPGPGDVSL